MRQEFRELTLPASASWKVELKLMRPTPVDGDAWGALAPLRGTPWEQTITVVSGEMFSHALHGYTMPLIRALRSEPQAQMIRMKGHACSLTEGRQCVGASDACRPCAKVPECYAAPLTDREASRAASVVALAWSKGYHVVVVTEEGEFSL